MSPRLIAFAVVALVIIGALIGLDQARRCEAAMGERWCAERSR